MKQNSYTVKKRFSALGNGIQQTLKRFLSLSFDVIRYNPLFRKAAFASCVTAAFTGAVLLVLFAVSSPELPPGNLFSIIDDVSESCTPDGSMPHVVLSSSGGDWASLTFFDGSELETGAGPQTQNRSRDLEYSVRPGETLSEIAYAYDIAYDFLAWYNKITNANRIRVGTVIIIPSLDNIEKNKQAYQQYKTRQRQTAAASPAKTTRVAARNIQIAHESVNSGSGVTVNFSIVNPPSNLKSYEWDLGDGKRSFKENPSNEYSQPRTYPVRLTAQDHSGNIYKSNPLYIDIPYPASMPEYSTTKFVTLSSPDEYFVVNGTIINTRNANINDVLDLSESDQFLTKARFKKSGYFGVTVSESNGREQYYSVFVSPIPTVHVDHEISNFNWYRTQFNSGTPSNCGPASAAMGISWGTEKYYPVSSARQAIGWQGNGSTSFDDLLKVIKSQDVAAELRSLRTMQDIKNVIDSGAIAIILFHTDGVRTARHDPKNDLFGKYYNDSVGHYVVVKGYSMNDEYLVIHDPIPSDWSSNGFRYADEISMIGRNRYFNTNEVLRSLRRNDMIVVPGLN